MYSVFKGGSKRLRVIVASLSISESLKRSISPKEFTDVDDLNEWRGGSRKKGGKTKWPKR